jgi:hypothetical protein
MLVMQAAAELLFANGKRVRVRAGLDLVAQRATKPNQRPERRLARLLEALGQGGRGTGKHAYHLSNQLAAATQHAQRRVNEHRRRLVDGGTGRSEKSRRRVQPRFHRGNAARELRVVAGKEGIEGLQQVRKPERRIADVRHLIVQAKNTGADLSQQRRAIDLFLDVRSVDLFHGRRQRTKRRQVLPRRLEIEAAEPRIVCHQSRGAGCRRIEVVLQIQVGPTQTVDNRRRL